MTRGSQGFPSSQNLSKVVVGSNFENVRYFVISFVQKKKPPKHSMGVAFSLPLEWLKKGQCTQYGSISY